MNKDTIAFILRGEVDLLLFTEALDRWRDLIDILSSEVGERKDITWEIAKLSSSDPHVYVQGISEDIQAVEKVVGAHGAIWDAIINNRAVPYSDAVESRARAISTIIDGSITGIEFITNDFETVISQSYGIELEEQKSYTLGSVTGRIKTLSIHNRKRFVLYDTIFNRAITCYYPDDLENLVDDSYKHLVVVTGKLHRDAESDRVTQITDVISIDPLGPSLGGRFEDAKGILPWKEGDDLPEDIIRRLRDND